MSSGFHLINNSLADLQNDRVWSNTQIYGDADRYRDYEAPFLCVCGKPMRSNDSDVTFSCSFLMEE